jgi:hypothetical protein
LGEVGSGVAISGDFNPVDPEHGLKGLLLNNAHAGGRSGCRGEHRFRLRRHASYSGTKDR